MVGDTLYGYRFVVCMFLVTIFIFFVCEWCNKNNRQYSLHVKNGFNDVVKEASRVSTLAKENQNSFLALIQNSEALGMMKAIKLLAPEQDIQILTGGVPVGEAEREIKEQQSECAKKLVKKCNEVLPTSRLTELAGFYPYKMDSNTSNSNVTVS